ncbi:flavodoxin family protein [Agathobaculum sp. NTUH-O15-33]|uniref:flavodoxin family protein n=1 Tax=Agathobaculum sp. NTUH-O15-33 TaxID=3079302 RepID=UPI002958C556|nr:flavodoxin family protein [Agathobaculum sp. NTUH-O15-33]WNX84267.1 flavodoxin family protein [Agathobaculum sp. NTUH-O15-33]
MAKRLLIYDVEPRLEATFDRRQGMDLLFSANPPVAHCIGCFGCWIKTPGRCVIKDRASVLPSYFAQCSEVMIVSPILYGGYSANVKAVLDRSIGYLLPYFRYIDGQMHHQMRHQNPFQLNVHFYGTCGDNERSIAKRLVNANAINLGAAGCSVLFYETAEEIGVATQ